MIKTQRPYFFFKINSRPVQKFKGFKTYVSTGDSENMENGEQVSFYNRPSRANVQPRLNDVIFAKMSNTDKTFLVDDTLSNYIFSTGFFDISSNNFEPIYLAYLIRSDEFDGYKNAYSEGTTQVSISDKRLKKIRVTYETDINKQKQIADFLDKKVEKIDKTICAAKQKKSDLEALKYSIINEHLLGGKNYKLKYLCKVVTGSTPKSDNQSYWNGDIKWATPVDLTDFKTLVETDRCITSKGLNSCATTIVPIGTTIISTRAPIGTVSLVGYPMCFNQGCKALVPNIDMIDPKFLFYSILNITDVLVNLGRGTTFMELSTNDLKNIKIKVPDFNKQKEIVQLIEHRLTIVDELIKINTKQLKELLNYKKSLIYEYVSGKKEVSHEFN